MVKWDFGTSTLHEEELSTDIISLELDALGLNRTYGVVFKIKDGKQQNTQIHYEIEVTCLYELSNQSYLFRLDKKQVFINEKPASSISEEFAEKCGHAFFPLDLVVDNYGIAKEIYNYPEIVTRWEAIEKELLQFYKHSSLVTQIHQRRQIIQNPKQLNRAILENDWFIQLYFSGVAYKQKSFSFSVPVFPSSKVVYSGKNRLTKHPKNPLKVKVSTTGKCVDNRSEFDLLNGNPANLDTNPTVKGEIEIFYQLNEKAQFDSVVGNCNLVFPSGKKRIVNWEIYNLKNKIPKTLAEKAKNREAIEAEDKKELKEKRQKKTYKLFGKNFKFGKNK